MAMCKAPIALEGVLAGFECGLPVWRNKENKACSGQSNTRTVAVAAVVDNESLKRRKEEYWFFSVKPTIRNLQGGMLNLDQISEPGESG